MKKIILLSAILFTIGKSIGQSIGIDRKGKSVFTHYSKEGARLDFSADEPVSLSYIAWARDVDFVRNNKDKTASLSKSKQDKFTLDTTVSKFRGVLLEISMLNSEDFLTLNDLLDINPGVGIKIGYQNAIGKFKHLDNIPKKCAYAFGSNLILNMDNIQLYNTENNKIEKKYPLTYGAEMNFGLFFKNSKPSYPIRHVLAFNTKLVQTWNDDDLISYQKIGDVTVLPDVVALKEFDGRYGKLNREITKFRFALSGPMYIAHVNPIPYVVVSAQSNDAPAYLMGVFTNFLSKSLTKTNFKIPTSLGIGFDTQMKHGSFSRFNFFLKGSIGFGESD